MINFDSYIMRQLYNAHLGATIGATKFDSYINTILILNKYKTVTLKKNSMFVINFFLMNIKTLTTAISEHIGSARVQYIDDSSFRLNNQMLKLRDNLVIGEKFAFRFRNLKDLLFSLRDSGIFPVNDDTITYILNRYRHLETEAKKLSQIKI